MAKFPEADARLFRNKFICRKCKSALRAPIMAILDKKVKCRKCNSKALRTVKKK
jgi:ribosomal protein L40E